MIIYSNHMKETIMITFVTFHRRKRLSIPLYAILVVETTRPMMKDTYTIIGTHGTYPNNLIIIWPRSIEQSIKKSYTFL